MSTTVPSRPPMRRTSLADSSVPGPGPGPTATAESATVGQTDGRASTAARAVGWGGAPRGPRARRAREGWAGGGGQGRGNNQPAGRREREHHGRGRGGGGAEGGVVPLPDGGRRRDRARQDDRQHDE